MNLQKRIDDYLEKKFVTADEAKTLLRDIITRHELSVMGRIELLSEKPNWTSEDFSAMESLSAKRELLDRLQQDFRNHKLI